jgi:hypothetical protein
VVDVTLGVAFRWVASITDNVRALHSWWTRMLFNWVMLVLCKSFKILRSVALYQSPSSERGAGVLECNVMVLEQGVA